MCILYLLLDTNLDSRTIIITLDLTHPAPDLLKQFGESELSNHGTHQYLSTYILHSLPKMPYLSLRNIQKS